MNKQTGGLRCGAEFDDEIPPTDPGEPEESDEEDLEDEDDEDNVEFA